MLMFLILSVSENEIHCSQHAKARPNIVEFEGLVHHNHREGDENCKRHHLLNDFELRQGVNRGTDTVGRHLYQLFEKCYKPANYGRHVPSAVRHVFKMPVPCVGHETVGANQHKD